MGAGGRNVAGVIRERCRWNLEGKRGNCGQWPGEAYLQYLIFVTYKLNILNT
jgi:hypothetical protein